MSVQGRVSERSESRFEQRSRERRRRPCRRIAWGALAVGLILTLAWTIWWSSLLSVRGIEVDGLSNADGMAVRGLAAVSLGTPLARVDTEAVADRVRQRITVAEVSVKRSWPSTLVIHAVPRTPVLILKNPEGPLEVIGIDGVAYATVTTPPKGVPVVTVTTAEARSRDALNAALSLVRALPEDRTKKVGAIEVSSANLVTFTLGKTRVVWGGENDARRKVEILEALLPTKPKVIDVSAPDTPVTR